LVAHIIDHKALTSCEEGDIPAIWRTGCNVAMMMKKNEIYKVKIEAWSSEGDGICRIDGMAVFVKGAVRGDLCDVRILKVLKSHAYAKIENIIEPSPYRIESDCAVFGKCGGCELLHVSYEEELRMKHERVSDALKRIGGIDIDVEDILPSPVLEGYRNKVIYQTADNAGLPVIGFYRRGSHDVFAADHCTLQSPNADKAAKAVRRFALENGVRMYDEATGKGTVRYIFYRSSSNGSAQICIVAAEKKIKNQETMVDLLKKECPELTGILLCYNPEKGNVALTNDIKVLWGELYLTDTLCGLAFRVSPLSFFQINRDQTENLYRTAIEFAGLTGEETVFDLYCGIGTISLSMARHAKKVIGAEIVPEAIEDAKVNARINGITNAEFICADAAAAAGQINTRNEPIDVVTVDPPRKGLSPAAIDAILQIDPKRIVYVSCDPATLARDLKLFSDNNYTILRAKPVDMFPRTPHVECVTLMSRVEK